MSHPPFGSAELKEILVGRVGLAEQQVPEDLATPFADLGLDSLALVEVLLAIQQRYDLVVPDEDAEHFGTLGETIAYVNTRLAETVP